MSHSHATRELALLGAITYLLVAVALVVTGPRPVCRLPDALQSRSVADAANAHQDFIAATRANVDATGFVLGCSTRGAALVGVTGLARAGTAYGHRALQNVLAEVDAGRASADALTTLIAEKGSYANPYAAIIRPIVSALAKVTQTIQS